MDSFSISSALKIFSEFGVLGLVIFLWWMDGKRLREVLEQGKEGLAAVMERDARNLATVLERYQHDMMEQREMYRANASLCRDFASIASDLRDIVTLNIQTMTQVDDAVRQNQFCPMLRVREEKSVALVSRYEAGPHNEGGR